MNSISQYLTRYKEEMPKWLQAYSPHQNLSFADVISGRIGYYPGCEFDGCLMTICNQSHTVHSYLYVDYGVSCSRLTERMKEPNCIRGYHVLDKIVWTKEDILPHGEHPLILQKEYQLKHNPRAYVLDEPPYCHTYIMERDTEMDDDWGAKRFALTYLFADGICSYYQLFHCEYKNIPWCFLLQDHAFGGNYDCFGRGGLMDLIIQQTTPFPMFVLCGENTKIWNGYRKLPINPIVGGMNHNCRSLYIRETDWEDGVLNDLRTQMENEMLKDCGGNYLK